LEKDAFFKFLSLNFIMCDDDAAPYNRIQTPSQEAAALSPLPVSFQTLVTTKDPCDYESPFLLQLTSAQAKYLIVVSNLRGRDCPTCLFAKSSDQSRGTRRLR
jgi:hypothetical protein